MSSSIRERASVPAANDSASLPLSSQAEAGAKKKQQQPRQSLSCTKCRERKVKCDRTKPCSACCARGQPRDCHFNVEEGRDLKPIQQSYELRRLRLENLRLKEQLRAGKLCPSDEEKAQLHAPAVNRIGRHGQTTTNASKSIHQRRFKGQEPVDNIYFGSPGLANIVNDFAKLQVGPKSLSYSMPRGADIYGAHNGPAYPFATMWPAYPQACIPALLNCLPPRDELFGYLEAFQKRAQSCSFPHTPDEITRKEVERFLQAPHSNAEAYPDMLAIIFAGMAQGVQNGVYDKSGGKWVRGAMEAESLKGDVYIAAAMQSLRMASFMNRPTLLGIQTLVMIGPYLTNSGRFLDAWTLFGTTIRLAHSMGLHRNPKYLDPSPPLRECALRQTLWWWMLHMDQQYSMTLGRPLGISGIGDCPPPDPLVTDPTVLRLSEYVNQFTVLARQILSSDRLGNSKIDDFTDRLRGLWDTMPETVRFDQGWLDPNKEIPEWPLDAMAAVFYGKTHNYLILLNRQRVENSQSSSGRRALTEPGTPEQQPAYSVSGIVEPSLSDSSNGAVTGAPERGRTAVISSSLSLLAAFLFFYHRVPAALICWTMGQQAFNASMILTLDAIETGDLRNMGHVEQAYAIFVELDTKGVHKLAALAVNRISWALGQLHLRTTERTTGIIGSHERLDDRTTTDQDVARDLNAPGLPSGVTRVVDTVMGNTGMLLLEDPGLQSFVPTSFAPLGWDMAGSNLSTVTQVQEPVAATDIQGHQASSGTSVALAGPQLAFDTDTTVSSQARPVELEDDRTEASNQQRTYPRPNNTRAYVGPNLHDATSMNMGGNPGWAARPAAITSFGFSINTLGQGHPYNVNLEGSSSFGWSSGQ